MIHGLAGAALPPRGQPPPHGTCHLWLTTAENEGDWGRFLTPQDTQYVDRHRRPTDRQLTTVSRSLVRLVAAHYLALPPELVGIDRRCRVCGTPGHGPPEVTDGGGLAVSASHGGGRVLVAATGGGGVGVDLEPAGGVERPDELAATILAAEEIVAYEALPGRRRADWLLRAWVRKEAALKALGVGLSADCSGLDVRGPRVRFTAPEAGTTSSIHVRDVATDAGYRAAVAATLPVGRVATFPVLLR